MNVELQILKHLVRDAHPTVAIVDNTARLREMGGEIKKNMFANDIRELSSLFHIP